MRLGRSRQAPKLVARSGRIKGVAVDRRVGQRFPSGIDAAIDAAIDRHAGRTTTSDRFSIRISLAFDPELISTSHA